MSNQETRECAVLNCTNTSINTKIPKIFIKVPTNTQRRKLWLHLANKDLTGVTLTTQFYICEDHFDLEFDILNLMEYKIMGPNTRLRLKQNCIPSKLLYNEMYGRDTDLYSSPEQSSQSAPNKRKRLCLTYEGEDPEDWKLLSDQPDYLKRVASHRKMKCNTSKDIDLEMYDSEEDTELDIMKEEIEIINRAVENLYKGRDSKIGETINSEIVKKENDSKNNQEEFTKISISTKKYDINDGIMFLNDNSVIEDVVLGSEFTNVKNINVLDENNLIKNEIIRNSEATNEEIYVIAENQIVKEDIVHRSKVTNFEDLNVLYEDHVIKNVVLGSGIISDKSANVFDEHDKIKNEMIFKPEISTDSFEIKVDRNTDTYNRVIDFEINKETCKINDVNLFIENNNEIISDEDVIRLENDETVIGLSKELYEDHIVKNELVLGPEKIQKVFISPNSPKDTFIYTYVDTSEKEKDFETKNHIQHHLWQHKDDNLDCHVCGKTFTFPNNLKRHLKVHSGSRPFKCEQCPKTFARKDYLKFHIHYHHVIGRTTLQRIRPTTTCNLCNKEFSSKCSRDHHEMYSCPKNINKQEICKSKVYTCDICNKNYRYRTSLFSHISRCHTNKRSSLLHECDYCGKKYKKKHNLQCHMQAKHLNIIPYKCRKCKESFTWNSCLANHEKKMHGMTRTKLKKYSVNKISRPTVLPHTNVTQTDKSSI